MGEREVCVCVSDSLPHRPVLGRLQPAGLCVGLAGPDGELPVALADLEFVLELSGDAPSEVPAGWTVHGSVLRMRRRVAEAGSSLVLPCGVFELVWRLEAADGSPRSPRSPPQHVLVLGECAVQRAY